jgi:hypothetical protein
MSQRRGGSRVEIECVEMGRRRRRRRRRRLTVGIISRYDPTDPKDKATPNVAQPLISLSPVGTKSRSGVNLPFHSRATSTISIPTIFNPFMDWTIRLNSLDDQPPDSGVPAD